MKAAITREVYSETYDNILMFDIDDTNYIGERGRITTQTSAIDGSIHIKDWGYVEGGKLITLGNISVNVDTYNQLLNMLKSSVDTGFLFHYKNSTYKVLVNNVTKTPSGSGYLVSISLLVIDKYSDGETS